MQGRGYRLRVPGNIQTIGAFDPNMKVPEVITANQTYYVRKDGSDANNGKFNTAAGAWLTIQKALTWVSQNLRIPSNLTVTIQIGDGFYNENLSLSGSGLGGQVILQGNTSNMNAVIIQVATGIAILSELGANLKIRYFVFHSGGETWPGGTGSCDFLTARLGGVLTMEQCSFTKTTGSHMVAERGGIIVIAGYYRIQAGCRWHVWASQTSTVRYNGPFIVDLFNTPIWTSHFAFADSCSVIQFYANITWRYPDPGNPSARGPRYLCSMCGAMYVAGAGVNYLPGNAAGSVVNASVYV